MKKSVGLLFSRSVVFSLMVSLMGFQTTMAFAVSDRGVAAAEIIVTGQSRSGEKPFVEVNGERAFSGRTFFSNGTVSTNEFNSATISLGKLGRIILSPSSSLTLSFSEGRIAGVLSKGNVSVSNMEGVSVTIDTPGESLKNEGTSASRFAVAVTDAGTGVAVESGTVLNKAGLPVKQDDDDDDDDDDHWKAWAWVAVIAGTVTAIVLIATLGDDDDDIVSPVR